MTKDDIAVAKPPVTSNGSAAVCDASASDRPVSSIEDKAGATKPNSAAFVRNGAVHSNAFSADDDSEAETDIEPGREAGPPKSIKHEGKEDAPTNGHDANNDILNKQKAADANHDSGEKPSSTLTSVSSPSRIDEQSSRAPSADSPQSPSKTSVDSDTLARNTAKRKRENDDGQEMGGRRRIRRESSPDATRSSAKKQPSSSPPMRQRRRTLSTQSAFLENGPKPGRRKPAPIRTSDFDDHDSDDSDGSQAHRHRAKSSATASHSHNASTNRKMPPTINTFKYRDRNGRTLLAKACYTDSVDVVKERLDENPGHLDEREYADNTPLQIAALRGDSQIVKFLINRGANVHTQNSEKDTPLIDAVENSNFEVVQLLLGAGVNPSQPNAKGEEPMELIPEDEEDEEITKAGKQIKGALLAAKERWKARRPSEAIDPQSSRRSVPAQSPRGSPSFANLARQATEPGSGRRAPRGASTRNDLLWISPTPQRLRKAAGEGDAEATSHILSMGATADSQAVLAAAKGCHQACLELLLAMGSPEIDPDPIPGLKEGWDTPLLAAIGQSGDNLGIIRTLLGQAGFNPTRKLFQGKTYFEIAKERAGSNSLAEYDLLKQAYDNFVRKHGSPKSSRATGFVKRSKRADADSPKATKSPHLDRQDSDAKAKRSTGAPLQRRGSIERPSSSGSHLQVPPKHKSRESSAAVSDRADSPSRRDKKRRISSSSTEEKAVPKQRKRLLTGKERREGAERKRRSSITSVDSAASTLKRANGETKKSKIRTSISPGPDKKTNNERKGSESSVPSKVKREAKIESAPGKIAMTDISEGTSTMASAKTKDQTTIPASHQIRSVAPTAPMTTSASVTDPDSEAKKRKREEDEASRKEDEQRRREKEAAERERKLEAERKAEADRQEQERKRKEKEEEDRVKKEQAEKEAQARREEEARELRQRSLDSERLPEGFFHALHDYSHPPTTDEQKLWYPLRAITTERLGKHCPDVKQHSGDASKWLLNFQVAILLGLKDWALSDAEFQAWPRVPLPTYLAAPVASWWTSCFAPRKSLDEESESEYWTRIASNRAKFVSLASNNQIPLFWIRVDDFAKSLDVHRHISGVKNEKGDLRIQLCTFSAKLKPPSAAKHEMTTAI